MAGDKNLSVINLQREFKVKDQMRSLGGRVSVEKRSPYHQSAQLFCS